MSFTEDLLDDVRAQLAPDDVVLKEARERRELTREAALTFPGTLRTFRSGSLAHGTANCPVHQRDKGLDADCGVVLDRRQHAELGPDGLGIGPTRVVGAMMSHLTALIQAQYPAASLQTTKRAIFIEFHQPLPSGEDPSVDLIVALNRRAGDPGLWIPNTERDSWDPSDPEKHTELFTSGGDTLRRTRARAVRLAKAENKRDGEPSLCSFNLEAFGWMFTEANMSMPQALAAMWRNGASDLHRRLTPDPAGVSAPIKVADRFRAITRLEFAATQLEAALSRDWDQDWVRSHLLVLWPEFIAPSANLSTKARLAAAMKSKSNVAVTPAGRLTVASGVGTVLKHPSSFGGQRGA